MNRYKIFFITILFIFLVACNNHQPSEKDNEELLENHETENLTEDFVKEETNESEQENDQVDEELNMDMEETFVAEYRVNENWSIEPIDDANEKVVLLTIDDAPDTYALEMAKTLRDLDANAIFFVNGHFLEKREEKEVLKEIYEMGFVIGNHTYSHKNLKDLTNEEQKREIVQVNDMVEEITGERPKFFRAPFGVYTDYAREVIANENMVHMNWSYGYDWEKDYMTKEAIANIMVNNPYLSNGANLLMHDREWTAAGLHEIVNGLRDKGFEIVDPKLIETKE